MEVLMNRNEAMDATHLAEFFQVEGVVADYDITLGNLVGMSLPPSFYPIPLYPFFSIISRWKAHY
jgi:hypothetical protein